MKKIITLIIFVYTLLLVVNTSAQKTIIDSLEKDLVLQQGNLDKYTSTKANLAQALRFSNSNKAINLIKSAIGEATATNNYTNIASVYMCASRIYRIVDSTVDMISKADSAIYFAKKSNDENIVAKADYHRGLIYEYLNDKEKANILYFRALKTTEKLNDWSTTAEIYYRLYGYFAETENINSEEKYAKLGLEAALKSKDAERICFAWQAIASTHNDKLLLNKNDKTQFDSAMLGYKNAFAVFNENKDRIIGQNQYGIIAVNIASMYFENKIGNYKDTVTKYATLTIANGKAQNDTRIQTNGYGLLSEIALLDKDYTKAEQLLLEAKTAIEAKGKDNKLSQMVYYSLSNLYKIKGDNAQALVYYEKYMEAANEINNSEKQKDSRKLEAIYESEKKTQQLELALQKAASQKQQKTLYSILALSLLFGSIFIFRSYHFKLKNSIKETNILQLQKNEAILNAKLQEEKAKLNTQETLQLQADQKIIAAQNEHLQKQVMAGVMQVEHKNEILQNLKTTISENKFLDKSNIKMKHILDEAITVDDDFDLFKKELTEINPTFFNALQNISKQKLTQLDLKYCAYIYMKFPTKHMANLLNVEASSIRMTKYRIKQKIGLSKEDDLDIFISSIV